MVQMKEYQFVGAKREMFLPAHIIVEIKPVYHPNTTSQSPATHKTRTTVHDTGNALTDANGEYRWLAAGRPGAGPGGYTALVDDVRIIQTGHMGHKTWHAGTPEGNATSFGVELAFGGKVVWNKALDNMCALHGAIIEMMRWTTSAAVLHQFWYGKYCSAQILNRGIWDYVLQRIGYWAEQARRARAGSGTVIDDVIEVIGGVVTAQPYPVKAEDGTVWDGEQDIVVSGNKFEAQRATVEVTVDGLNRRRWANTDAPTTGGPLPKGTEVDVLGWVAGELVEGISEWAVTKEGHRIWVGGLDYEPKEDPDYGAQPEVPPGIEVVNGRLYYPLIEQPEEGGVEDKRVTGPPVLGREVTVSGPAKLHRWADSSTEVTGTLAEGDTFFARYWTRGEDLPLGESGATENIWYAEHLHSGDRLWSGMSTDRPD